MDIRNALLFIVGLLTGSTALAQSWQEIPDKPDTAFHLYLLVGQSNMAGRACLDSFAFMVHRGIMTLDSNNRWVPARDPLHYDKPSVAGVGPGITFAITLQRTSKATIGLIPCAWGGSPISVWQPDSIYLKHYPYDEAIAKAKLAMRYGVLKGIIWHQGESDNDTAKAVSYTQELTALVLRFRQDLGMPELPFVAGEIGYFNKKDFINKEIRKIPGLLPYTRVVSAHGLHDKGDRTHFDAKSARILGQRYAKLMLEIQQQVH